MDDFTDDDAPKDRLSQLSVSEGRTVTVNHFYSAFVRKLRVILPLIAVGMTVVIITWNEAGKRVEPMKKEDLLPSSQNIQNELLKPVFNSVTDKNEPYTVTADRAAQDRENPDLVRLENPAATLTQTDGSKVNADAAKGIYEQKTQKLNLEGNVTLSNSGGYTLTTDEMRVDMNTQKAYSGRDVHVAGPSGTIDATGLEGDAQGGALIFTGPARVILYNNGNLLTPKGSNKP